MSTSPLDLDGARRVIERAHGLVGDLAAQGAQRMWVMHVPPDPERDTDLILSAGLTAGERLAAEVERLRALIGEVAIPSLAYCEERYGLDNQARLNLEAGIAQPNGGDGESACRVCGCTQNTPCQGGCHWVPDPYMAGELCSGCAASVPLPAEHIELFLKRERDRHEKTDVSWHAVDDVLDALRLHLVTGTPLTEAEELRAEVERLRGELGQSGEASR